MIDILISVLAFVPFGLVMYIAYVKGFPRLFLLVVVAIAIGIINIVFNPSDQFRNIERNVFSFILLLHALDLKDRKEKK